MEMPKGVCKTKIPNVLKSDKQRRLCSCIEGKLAKSQKLNKTKSQNAPLPYDLTELQQVANSLYQYSAKKTLNLVQSLYETHKIVSYPRRTRSTCPKT